MASSTNLSGADRRFVRRQKKISDLNFFSNGTWRDHWPHAETSRRAGGRPSNNRSAPHWSSRSPIRSRGARLQLGVVDTGARRAVVRGPQRLGFRDTSSFAHTSHHDTPEATPLRRERLALARACEWPTAQSPPARAACQNERPNRLR